MERQGHARAESEWQHALDLEKKLKACSRWAVLLFLAPISSVAPLFSCLLACSPHANQHLFF